MNLATCPICKQERTFELKPSFQSLGGDLIATTALNVVCSEGHEFPVIDYNKLTQMATKIDKTWEILQEIEKRLPKSNM